VKLPYKSLVANKSYELYQYQHFNKLPRKEGETCPFCRLSRRVEIICETATCVAFYDGYTVSPGHALIIPKRHVANYFDLTNHEREAMNVVLQYVKQKVDERFHPDGYNVGININEAAGQSVFHCHMHLIPRYKGDVPNPKGGVRGVIPSKQSYSTSQEPSYELTKKVHSDASNKGRRWSKEEDKRLSTLLLENRSQSEIAMELGRSEYAIFCRTKKFVDDLYITPDVLKNEYDKVFKRK
jgi:diadenosine tetraphosphate (Ap4A) HIT family hydrolase